MSDLRIRGVHCLVEQPYSAMKMIIPAYLQISINILYEVLCSFCAGGGWWRSKAILPIQTLPQSASRRDMVLHLVL
jgi:hypothetical protein